MNVTPEIIAAFTTALVTLGGGAKFLINRKDRLHKEELLQKDIDHKKKLELLELENTSNRINLSVLRNFQKMKFFSELEKFSKMIFRTLGSDRFLILIAVNGTSKPNKISVLYGNEIPSLQTDVTLEERYFETKIDDNYREMLYFIENKNHKLLVVEDMENCILKNFYEDEGVKTSLVFFLNRYNLNERDDAIIFCSIAVHKNLAWPLSKCSSVINLTRSKVIPILNKIVK